MRTLSIVTFGRLLHIAPFNFIARIVCLQLYCCNTIGPKMIVFFILSWSMQSYPFIWQLVDILRIIEKIQDQGGAIIIDQHINKYCYDHIYIYSEWGVDLKPISRLDMIYQHVITNIKVIQFFWDQHLVHCENYCYMNFEHYVFQKYTRAEHFIRHISTWIILYKYFEM